jgi:peroxiredoxin
MLKPGDKIPEVTFKVRKDGEWVDVTSGDLFDGKTVVLFALPGAFTPTCSSTHLPGYLNLSEAIRNEGVDDILCLSVNDSFVMNAWAKDQGIDDEVTMVPDGSGLFTKGMGLLVNKDHLGFGERSWRYSMLVVDGVIEKMFVEDFNDPGDPFEVSDAGAMLDYLKQRNAKAAE